MSKKTNKTKQIKKNISESEEQIKGPSFIRRHLRPIILCTILILLLGAAVSVVINKTQLGMKLDFRDIGQSVDRPFRVSLGQSVKSIDNISIEPKIEGEWRFESNALGVEALEFMPKDKFSPGHRYKVTLGDITRQFTSKKSSEVINFSTEEAPGILSFSLPNQEGLVIPADTKFSMKLNDQDGQLDNIILETTPSVEMNRTDISGGFSWAVKGLLPQGNEVELVARSMPSGKKLLLRKVKVAEQPTISSVSKESDIVSGESIEITFSKQIDVDKSLSEAIAFNVAGRGEWTDGGLKYRFTPEALNPGQSYEYKIAKGLRTKEGGILIEDIEKNFTTRGAVAVVGYSPTGSSVGQATQYIKLTFNQPVDHVSAEKSFGVSSGTVEGFSWSGNTLTVAVSNLGFQKKIDVWLSDGVKPSGFGLPSRGWGYTFNTEVRTIKLAVPYYSQAYAQSCEAADVRMALAYRGIYSNDWDILQRFGYNPRPKNQETNTWDDPQQQFVGDVDGHQKNGTGWGVYAEPVASAVRSFGRQAVTQYGVSASFLAEQIYNDRPVVVWGIWGGSAEIQSWTTPSGSTASGPFTMHVRLVTGVVGSVDNPLGFYVHDPITGPDYWTASQLISNTYKAGPANQAVVIF